MECSVKNDLVKHGFGIPKTFSVLLVCVNLSVQFVASNLLTQSIIHLCCSLKQCTPLVYSCRITGWPMSLVWLDARKITIQIEIFQKNSNIRNLKNFSLHGLSGREMRQLAASNSPQGPTHR